MTEQDVSEADVRHVAELARVDLPADDVERFVEQFADILAYFESLDEVPAVDREADLTNVMRADEVRPSLEQSAALSNASDADEGYFTGPNVS